MSSQDTHPADERHEQRDVSRRSLLIFAVLFAAFVAGSIVLLWLIFGTREGGFAAAQPRDVLPINGELEQSQQLVIYLDGQRQRLHEFRWTDRTKTFAKIPIDDAMALLAAKRATRRPTDGTASSCPLLETEVPRAASVKNCGAEP